MTSHVCGWRRFARVTGNLYLVACSGQDGHGVDILARRVTPCPECSTHRALASTMPLLGCLSEASREADNGAGVHDLLVEGEQVEIQSDPWPE